MQIHEITKLGKKRTDEGLLDTFKQAVGITPKPGEGPTKFQKMTNPSLAAVEKNKKALGPAAASIAKLKAQGYDVSAAEEALAGYGQAETPQQAAAKAGEQADIDKLLNQAIQQTQQDQQVQSTINQDTQEFKADFVPPLLPEPGQMFTLVRKVGTSDVTFTKDDKGIWRNENKQVIQPKNAAGLEQQLDSGNAKQIPAPKPEPVAPLKGSKNKPVAESILREAAKTLEQTAFENFVAQKVNGKDEAGHPISFAEVLKIPKIRKRLRTIFVTMYKANNATPPDRKAVIDGFKQYMTTAFAGLKVVDQQRSTGDSEVNDDDMDTVTQSNTEVDPSTVKQLAGILTKIPRGQRKATVKQAVDTMRELGD